MDTAVPTPVIIAEEQQPIPVVLPKPRPAKVIKDSFGKPTLSPTTTEAEDMVTAGQRRINIMWEVTQASIAVMISAATVFVMAYVAMIEHEVSQNQMLLIGQLNVMTTLILTSYFTRTNHTRIGGVGRKTDEGTSYEGR